MLRFYAYSVLGQQVRKVQTKIMRIAFFAETFLPKIDGITNTICYLLDHLAMRGHESLLFGPEGAPDRYANTPVVGLPAIQFPLYPELKLVPPRADVKDRLTAFQPDLVHLVGPVSLGVVGLNQARALEVPIVASYHTDIPGFAARWGFSLLRDPLWTYLRWLHNQADLNLCPSKATETELLEHGFERTKIWSRGVDTQLYNPARRSDEWRNRLSPERPEAPLLLYVGRLSPEKRVDWLRPVLSALPEVNLAIVGDGPARPDLEQRFADTPTVFTGYLRGEELAAAYATADIFVFPAANETLGNVVLEAMASGLPVIAPRSGGVLENVVDDVNGLYFEPESQHDLVAKVRQLVFDKECTAQLGVGSRKYAEAKNWSTILDQLLADYEMVIANANPTGRSMGQVA